MKKSICKNLSIVVLVLIVIFALGASMALQSFTLVEWWIPTSVCAVIAVAVTIPFGRLIRQVAKFLPGYLKYPIVFILFFSILLSTFYIINYQITDPMSSIEYSAPVVRKYSEERTRTKRSGRRSYGEEKYNVYFIEIELCDGRIKKLERPLREYLKIRKGDKIRLKVEKGLFGINVIKLDRDKLNSNK